jgi:hypothetical protein
MVKLSGGGLNSRVVTHSKAPKVEPRSRAVSPEATDQLGQAVQFRKPPLVQGRGYEPKSMGPTGIANARQGHAGVGPGGGNRTIYKSGSQSPTPPAREMPEGRNTLAEYGPDIPGSSDTKK